MTKANFHCEQMDLVLIVYVKLVKLYLQNYIWILLLHVNVSIKHWSILLSGPHGLSGQLHR